MSVTLSHVINNIASGYGVHNKVDVSYHHDYSYSKDSTDLDDDNYSYPETH